MVTNLNLKNELKCALKKKNELLKNKLNYKNLEFMLYLLMNKVQ